MHNAAGFFRIDFGWMLSQPKPQNGHTNDKSQKTK
jgi:hypothetical protein